MLLPWCILMILKKSSMKHLQPVSDRFHVKTSWWFWEILMQEWAVMWCLGQLFLDIMGKVHATQMENYFISFCAEQQMTVSNTLFQMPDKWFYSWQHPRSKRYHLLDYVLVRQSDIQDITSTRIMRGADCSTDHFLVRTICKFHVKPNRRTKASVPKRVNVRSLVDDYEMQTKFQEALASKLNSLDQSSETSINEQWQSISAATHKVMLENL